MADLQSLIGKKVKATGNCGTKNGIEVEGILTFDNGIQSHIVTVDMGKQFGLPCSVYSTNIKEI